MHVFPLIIIPPRINITSFPPPVNRSIEEIIEDLDEVNDESSTNIPLSLPAAEPPNLPTRLAIKKHVPSRPRAARKPRNLVSSTTRESKTEYNPPGVGYVPDSMIPTGEEDVPAVGIGTKVVIAPIVSCALALFVVAGFVKMVGQRSRSSSRLVQVKDGRWRGSGIEDEDHYVNFFAFGKRSRSDSSSRSTASGFSEFYV